MSYKVGDKVCLVAEIIEMSGDVAKVRFEDESTEKFIIGFLKCPKTYEDGLKDAWELARQIVLDDGMECDTFMKIFGTFSGYEEVLRTMTPQEAFSKIEAYEKSQQIQVGDVVKVRTGAGSEHLGVVTQITANQNCACIVYADGSTEMNTANNMTKTNKHLDIEHLLEQIRRDK